MDVSCEYIDYNAIDSFPKLIIDYLSNDQKTKNFYELSPDIEGIKKAIIQRKNTTTNRASLVEHLSHQYSGIQLHNKVADNIQSLLKDNTFTVCTAHQPNIFTGHLYFIYKILHTIKLADHLNSVIPEDKFVPVFYMGNEDADLEELGHIYINGKKYEWKTKQTGAVGKMLVDDELIKLIGEFSGQIGIQPFGNSITKSITECYKKGITIQQATLIFVDRLFGSFGLVTLIPDSPILKRSMIKVFEDDIFNHSPFNIVSESNTLLEKNYKVQAQPREINLFYIEEQLRKRIIKKNDLFIIEDSNITFTEASIRTALHEHPEKFSPNVILRGLYQETILPNLAFIGGGGEISYWLQLASLFKHYQVPFPVLLLRNSFMIIDQKTNVLRNKLKIKTWDLFNNEIDQMNGIVLELSSNNTSLENSKNMLHSIYKTIKENSSKIDSTLEAHVDSLEKRAIEKIEALEKKMIRAEKRKYTDQENQLKKLRSILFPNEILQERVENIIPFYSKWGDEFFINILKCSQVFEQQFCIVKEN